MCLKVQTTCELKEQLCLMRITADVKHVEFKFNWTRIHVFSGKCLQTPEKQLILDHCVLLSLSLLLLLVFQLLKPSTQFSLTPTCCRVWIKRKLVTVVKYKTHINNKKQQIKLNKHFSLWCLVQRGCVSSCVFIWSDHLFC